MLPSCYNIREAQELEERWKRDSDRPLPPISTVATTEQKKIKLDWSNSKALKSSTFKCPV